MQKPTKWKWDYYKTFIGKTKDEGASVKITDGNNN